MEQGTCQNTQQVTNDGTTEFVVRAHAIVYMIAYAMIGAFVLEL